MFPSTDDYSSRRIRVYANKTRLLAKGWMATGVIECTSSAPALPSPLRERAIDNLTEHDVWPFVSIGGLDRLGRQGEWKEFDMPNNGNNQGGSHEQHVKAGQQSHKNDAGSSSDRDDNANNGGSSNRGGSHEQHVKAGQQSHKNG